MRALGRLVVHVLPFLFLYIVAMALGAFGLGRLGLFHKRHFRGMMVQEYFASGRTFSIPVLWLTNILVLLLGTVMLAMPSRDGIERMGGSDCSRIG